MRIPDGMEKPAVFTGAAQRGRAGKIEAADLIHLHLVEYGFGEDIDPLG
jgi:transcriptional regulator with PAS, ATPase and Fis domain